MKQCSRCRRRFPDTDQVCHRDQTRLETTDDPYLHASLPGYRLQRFLREGGMGWLYAGEQTGLGRAVAVKILRPEYSASAELAARFRAEAQIVAQLKHPHIVDVIDLGESDAGFLYLVLELLNGQDLQARLGTPLETGKVLAISAAILSALAYAHRRGVIHRDLKPTNVFLADVGGVTDWVKLLDFGVAKIRGLAGVPRTLAGMMLGTPGHMAPEQIRVEAVDHRCDIYAFGVVLYELCTGRAPFGGDDADSIIRRQLEQPPPDLPDEARRRLPAGLPELLNGCLRKKPEERFSSVEDLAGALGTVFGVDLGIAPPQLDEMPTSRRPGSVPLVAVPTRAHTHVDPAQRAQVLAHRRRYRRRSTGLALGAGVALGVLGLSLLLLLWRPWQSAAPTERPALAPPPPRPARAACEGSACRPSALESSRVANVLGFKPTNIELTNLDFNGVGDVELAGACNLDQGVGFPCHLKGANRKEIIQANGAKILVFTARSFRIEQTATIRACAEAVQSHACSMPIAIVALDKIEIVGTLVSAGGFYAAQGGFRGTDSNGKGVGPGGGARRAGGSFCGKGGDAANDGESGPTYGDVELSPLIGGSAGGAGETAVSGSGGGAVQLVAGTYIRIGGAVNVGGGGGYAGSAGGSGGALLLEAPRVVITGAVAANGGGGAGFDGSTDDRPAKAGKGSGVGSAGTVINGAKALVVAGGGGAGRIRINTSSGAATIKGTISPALSTPCVTQGRIAR